MLLRVKILAVSLMIFLSSIGFPQQIYKTSNMIKSSYIQLSGNLFEHVQLSGIFKDSKTFVDALPLKTPESILNLYDSVKTLPDFDLREFVYANFNIPREESVTETKPTSERTMKSHIESLWNILVRKPEDQNPYGTLLTLKYPYIVPGGRFREIYYWDSYFTILGLLAGKKTDIAENMVNNFAYLLDKYKMIPNGNRIYYITRSQPPFFSLMIDALCQYKKDYNWGAKFLPALLIEYNFWMRGEDSLPSASFHASENVVKIDNEEILNRYFDSDNIPREESFKEDYLLSKNIPDSAKNEFFRNLRAAAESGWDFSSRWFSDQKSLNTIETTNILPVDLNCLLYFLEDRISYFYKLNGQENESKLFGNKAHKRLLLINKIFWNEKEGFYFDYNWKTKTHTNVFSLASCFPLYFSISDKAKASKVAEKLKESFLKPGGLLTTLNSTKQQWDAPNGWAPLQWIAVKALREYGFDSLAVEIKTRWLNLNNNVYKRTGRMLEKYNVEDITLFAGGGEYPLQDGFGWTNGIASAFLNDLDKFFANFGK
ncbi:MAG: alpha,alpha-trehalase TreF [Bacillota bacterium]